MHGTLSTIIHHHWELWKVTKYVDHLALEAIGHGCILALVPILVVHRTWELN